MLQLTISDVLVQLRVYFLKTYCISWCVFIMIFVTNAAPKKVFNQIVFVRTFTKAETLITSWLICVAASVASQVEKLMSTMMKYPKCSETALAKKHCNNKWTLVTSFARHHYKTLPSEWPYVQQRRCHQKFTAWYLLQGYSDGGCFSYFVHLFSWGVDFSPLGSRAGSASCFTQSIRSHSRWMK